MKTLRLIFPAALAVWLACMGGCKTGPKFDARPAVWPGEATTVTVTNQLDPELLKPAEAMYTLGPGDIIEVELTGDATSRAILTVGPDGRVYFNILPGVEIWGLTLAEAKARLEGELKKYLSQPTLNVSLRGANSKFIWLLGRVSRPGLYPMTGPTRLLEALALAGGTEPAQSTGNSLKVADLQRSFVMRQGTLLPVDFQALLQGDMSQNIYLKPDDFLFVASAQAEEIYVLGGVRSPHPLPFRENMTLVSAIAASGGTLPDVYDTHIAVVRGSLSTPQIAVIDYKAIINGQAGDVRLQPRDIVFVPWLPWRDIKVFVKQLTGVFVSTLAANAGATWVDPNADGVGISANPNSGGGGDGGGGGSGGGGGN